MSSHTNSVLSVDIADLCGPTILAACRTCGGHGSPQSAGHPCDAYWCSCLAFCAGKRRRASSCGRMRENASYLLLARSLGSSNARASSGSTASEVRKCGETIMLDVKCWYCCSTWLHWCVVLAAWVLGIVVVVAGTSKTRWFADRATPVPNPPILLGALQLPFCMLL